MKIAIIGYGRMGKIIEKLAIEQGHEVPLTIGSSNLEDFTPQNLQKCDVAIEFSLPSTAFTNIKTCLEAGLPVISGTTAWLDQLDEVKQICKVQQGAFFYASNYSIGVNIFFALNEKLAQLMQPHAQYDIKMEEIHHTQKLDAPSGTAITLAEGILRNNKHKKSWVKQQATNAQELPILSKRIDKVPGTHTVAYDSVVDNITISHVAHSRKGFAMGAITAAQWLIGKQGTFSMKDMLNL